MRSWTFSSSQPSRLLIPACIVLGLGSFVACGGGGDSSGDDGTAGLSKEGPAVNFAQLVPKQGSVVVTKMELKGDIAIRAQLEGQEMTGSVKTVGSTVEEATFVRVTDGKAAEILLKSVEEKQSTTSNMMGQVSTEEEDGAFVGRELREVKGPNGWEVQLVGAPATLEQQAELSSWEFYVDGYSEIYPDRTMKVGDTWNVEGEEALAIFGNDQDMESASLAILFAGYQSCDSGQCAVLTGEMKMSGSINEGLPMQLSFGGKFKSVVDPVSGVSPLTSLKGEMSMEGSMGPGAQLKGSGPMNMIMTQSLR